MKYLTAIVLAAGEGKRMKSSNSKVTHKICGKSLIQWVCKSLDDAQIGQTIVVVGHRSDQVIECLGDSVSYIKQSEQLGTGHAVMQAKDVLLNKEGYVLILCGDTPLVSSDTILQAIEFHKHEKNSATIISADLDDPYGYGRIVRDKNGNVLKIVEQKDTSQEENMIREVNSGMYCFTIKNLLDALEGINNKNSQGEYYLTDTIEELIRMGGKVGAIKVDDSKEILGINDRIALLEASNIIKNKILKRHMLNGVTILQPESTFIDEESEIGMDTIIYPCTIIEGETRIGNRCIVGPNTKITDCKLGDDIEVINSVVMESSIGDTTKVGPFAYIRPGSEIGCNVRIGDFVEIKKSVIGDKTKISHLTYVGDAEIGKGVNLGCGVVVVNYDGVKKNRTIVGDNAFIGCNVNLISPVEVKQNSYVAAGSTINREVPEYALAIARNRQKNIDGWVKERANKK